MLTKITKIISYVLSISILLLAIFVIVNVATAKTKGLPPNIFGYSFHIVVTSSMKGEIDPGDFVIAKSIESKDVRIGDNIVFKSIDPKSYGLIIIHQVIAIEEKSGQYFFTTKGVKEGLTEDEYKVTDVLGKSCYVSSAFAPLLLDSQAKSKVILIFVFVILGIVILISSKSIIKSMFKSNKRS